MQMGEPENIEKSVNFNSTSGNYEFDEKLGNRNFRNPSYMEFDDYIEQQRKKSIADYWKDKSDSDKKYKKDKKELRPELEVESETFDRIFGGNKIDIKPTGSAELRFGLRSSRNENPVIPERQRSITNFQYDQSIQLNVLGNIGDKVKVTMNVNTDATFAFDNRVKLDYTGYEDDILQDIEVGNVAMPLNSSLITGSQSLLGIKTKLKFGRLNVTTLLSQQQGKKSQIRTEGGAQITQFETRGDNYEANRHFFLSHFFRNLYEDAVSQPPMYNTGVRVTRVEVWVTNTRANPENPRDIVAFQDLGTTDPNHLYNPDFVNIPQPNIPASSANNDLYNTITGAFGAERNIVQSANILDGQLGLNSRLDYQRVEFARKLAPSEYDLNDQLGYISLRQQINSNQVLAVAFEYTYQGNLYQVGEFSVDIAAPRPLFLKMLKSVELNTHVPMWDLMMKNIYNIGAYQVQRDGFELDVWYLDQNLGIDINYIPEDNYNNRSLVQLLGLDKLNINQKPVQDGVFDFLPGFTIIERTGRIIFPLLEPFGSGIRKVMPEPLLAEKYAFDSLYTRTQADAQNLFPAKNRFSIKGEYKSSSSSEISLNALNVPEGSVTVTAGGAILTENVDYTVNYQMGRVTIINQGLLDSNTPIDVSLESNELFAQQQKNLVGARFDYKVNKDIILGGTFLRLGEKPITPKIDYGNEPVSNMIWGMDGSYRAEVPLITKLVDKIPFIDTKAKSSVKMTGEFAHLIPGHAGAIGRSGNSYIDDFEGSQSFIDMRTMTNWRLAATPQSQPELFPEGNLFNNQASGHNRALFNWRVVDPLFYQNNAPQHVKDDPDMLSDHRMRQIFEQEVFPNRSVQPFSPNNIAMLDVSFYPTEKGPYNYDVDDLNEDGSLANPKEKWGGITRRVDQNDFEAANIEFLQFWLMDPFNEDADPDGTHRGGDLYINLGNISEDVMYDGQNIFEQDLPNVLATVEDLTPDTISNWGRVTRGVPLASGFDNDPGTRGFQDVGMDGLRDDEEQIFFADYLEAIAQKHGVASPAYQAAFADPSNDSYNYYRDDDYDALQLNILERYKLYNGTEGNSPTQDQYAALNQQGYPTSATTVPDKEDLNADNVVNNVEGYYQYRIRITRNDINPNNVGQNFITNVLVNNDLRANGEEKPIRWYQFKIPLKGDMKEKIGSITDFRSIRFMRMYTTGFEEEVHLRFARLEFIRGEWRRYLGELDDNAEGFANDEQTTFNIRAVSIEENSAKTPVNYVLPPGIYRELNVNTTNLQQYNEQAMSFEVCDLQDGYAQAAYRNIFMDMRMYRELRMYVHAEQLPGGPELRDNDLSIFVRLGTDFTENYYEYELPLLVTDSGFYIDQVPTDQEAVWPAPNEVKIPLEDIRQTKVQRDKELLNGADLLLKRKRYERAVGRGKIYVVGSPNLGEVKVAMIGVRNTRQELDPLNDDGLPKCAEIWVNEMRLSEFDERTGWAALGRVTANLADLANVSLAGSISTPGFGSLEQKVNERQKETKKNIDASTSIQLGKFFPEKSGVQIPMFVGYSKATMDPMFSPLAEDVPFEEYVKSWDTRAERDSIKKVIQDQTIRKSINFTNVKKTKTGSKDKKSTPLDISNFSFNYSYSEELRRDFDTEHDITRNYRGGFNYAYSIKSKSIKPFSKIKYLRRINYLRLVREANIKPLPSNFTFQTNMNRQYNERQVRNNNPGIRADLPAFFNKTWTWDRVYSTKWDITKNLKFDYNATNRALVDEPNGAVDRENRDEYLNWRGAVLDEIASLGTNLDYRHNTNLSYKIPLEMVPMLNFISSNVRYGSSYNWRRAPLADTSGQIIGNTVQNSGNFSWSANFNMRTLYNKVDYLKKVQQEAKRRKAKKEKERRGRKTKEEITEGGEESADDKKQKKKKEDKFTVVDRFFNLLMSVQSGSISYSQNRGLVLPGFDRESRYAGMDKSFQAPGPGFILGKQDNFGPNDTDYFAYAAEQGWLIKSPNLNMPASQTLSQNLNIRATVQPMKDLRITLSADQRQSENTSSFFRFVPADTADPLGPGVWENQSPVTSGSFSSAISTWRTAFVPLKANNSSETFEQFLEYRSIISNRLEEGNPESEGAHYIDTGDFRHGYGATSMDVLVPAFLAAYTGGSPNHVTLNPFKVLPRFNWRLNYTGLSKIPALKKYFRTVTINHSYSSNLSIGGYINNQRYVDNDGDGFADLEGGFDLDSNFITQNQYQSISISENFGPLIGVDVKMKNGFQGKLEFKRSRTLTLNASNTQLMELRSLEYVLGGGYTFKNVTFPFEFKPGKKIKNDLKVRADFSVRDNITVIHKIADFEHETTAGMFVFSIKMTADYKMSDKLTLRAFYDRILNNPKMTNTFLNANSNYGISLRFTLS